MTPPSAGLEGADKPQLGWWRRHWPWVTGAVLLAVVVTRVPTEALREAMSHGPWLALALVELLFTTIILGTDSLSTWAGLIAARLRRPFYDVLVARGATNLLLLLNYAVSQGGFGYYLHRTGTGALRAAGVTLFLIGTNLATLLVVTTLAWAAHWTEPSPTWWILLVGCAGLGVYLVVIGLAPSRLVRREVLTPLFDAGARGHALAMLARLPHVAAIVLWHWFALRTWGIAVPFWVGVTLMPMVAIVTVLPISPAGLGTTQAALVYFFSEYAAGATSEAQAAATLAFGIAHFGLGVVAALIVGLACAPLAKRVTDRLPALIEHKESRR